MMCTNNYSNILKKNKTCQFLFHGDFNTFQCGRDNNTELYLNFSFLTIFLVEVNKILYLVFFQETEIEIIASPPFQSPDVNDCNFYSAEEMCPITRSESECLYLLLCERETPFN